MKIYFHIGAGKTGTSSIQHYLKSHTRQLHEQGVFYAGMRFDSLGKDKVWKQKSIGYSKLTKSEFTHELLEAINTYVAHCQLNGLHTLVVSNESFSGHIRKFMDLFGLLDKQHDLKVVHYLRQPESWLISAYQQWGIRNKVKKGPVISSKRFIVANKQNNMLKPLIVMKQNGLAKNIIARNFETCKNKDVVADFCDILGVNYNGTKATNQKLSDFEEVFYFLVNNQEARAQSTRKAKTELKLLEDSVKANKVFNTINVSAKHFDAHEMVSFKKKANKFLDESSQFEETFTPKTKINTLDVRMVNCIERYLHLKKQNTQLQAASLEKHLGVDELFAGAVQLETVNLHHSRKLMLAAQSLRPNGPQINNKLEQYNSALEQGVTRFQRPKRSLLTILKRYFGKQI